MVPDTSDSAPLRSLREVFFIRIYSRYSWQILRFALPLTRLTFCLFLINLILEAQDAYSQWFF
jgi:hypothetical protein